MITVLVTGSREFSERDVIRQWFQRIDTEYEAHLQTLLYGGARGVDTWAKEEADKLGWDVVLFPAMWDRDGRGAGFKRNVEMVEALYEAGNKGHVQAVAFWDGQSRGTRHCFKEVMRRRLPLDILIRYGEDE